MAISVNAGTQLAHIPAFGHRVLGQDARGVPVVMAVLLAVCTIVFRSPDFGNPTYHIDEAFYRFVGERMNEGTLPYADIWDRKPAGLFVLYALMAKLGGVYVYQAFAGAFAWATAFVLGLASSRFVDRTAALLAGAMYLALLGALAGGGGQSPVFYNFFVALAALCVLKAILSEQAKLLTGEFAMILCGIALTIKPTVLAEGMFFGLALLAVRWRSTLNAPETLRYAMKLCALAAAPTSLIFLLAGLLGHFDTYWFATMQSVFLVEPASPHASMVRLTYLLFTSVTAWLAAILGLLILWTAPSRANGYRRGIAIFVSGWAASALAGFCLVPNFFDHYALPVASVLAVSSAALFNRKPAGPIVAAIITVQLLITSGFPFAQSQRTIDARNGLAEATALIATHRSDGCIFVYDATPALYADFKLCSSNRFVFPEHLSNQREAKAIGTDPVVALNTIMDEHPAVIVLPRSPSVATPNWATRQRLEARLRTHYEQVGEAVLVDVVGRQDIAIWALASGAKPRVTALSPHLPLGQ